MSVILPGAPRPNPHKPVQPLAADIEAGLINTCCLREDNLYVSEYETDHRMVRKCRRCHRKHYTMKADAIDLATTQPRKLLDLPVTKIEPGAGADLMLFDWQDGGDLTVREVV